MKRCKWFGHVFLPRGDAKICPMAFGSNGFVESVALEFVRQSTSCRRCGQLGEWSGLRLKSTLGESGMVVLGPDWSEFK